jgi:hypothetical protein
MKIAGSACIRIRIEDYWWVLLRLSARRYFFPYVAYLQVYSGLFLGSSARGSALPYVAYLQVYSGILPGSSARGSALHPRAPPHSHQADTPGIRLRDRVH